MSQEHHALRSKLGDELKTLQTQLKAIKRDIHRPKSADFEEQATDSENDEVLDALEVETRKRIEGLQSALSRIEEGTYGTCATCGKAISDARLEAVPWAHCCVRCAD